MSIAPCMHPLLYLHCRLNPTRPQWDTAALHNSSSEYMEARRGGGGEGEDMQ